MCRDLIKMLKNIPEDKDSGVVDATQGSTSTRQTREIYSINK
jgi:hypothetical protein